MANESGFNLTPLFFLVVVIGTVLVIVLVAVVVLK